MHRLLLSLALLGCLLPATPATALENDAAELIALEIRNLSTSVDRLTQLLYDQGQQDQQETVLRKLDIAVAYLNFRSRRIEMLERDKQNNEALKHRLEDILQQMDTRLAQLEEEAQDDPAIKDANDSARQETLEQIKIMKQRLTRVEETLIDYENQIVELRNQLDDVEGFVERHLEL